MLDERVRRAKSDFHSFAESLIARFDTQMKQTNPLHVVLLVFSSALLAGCAHSQTSCHATTMCSACTAQAPNPSSQIQSVTQAEATFLTDVKAHNADALDNMLEPQFLITGPDGNTISRADFLSDLRQGRLVVPSGSNDDLSVNAYGSAAVASGTLNVQATKEGNDISGAYRFIDVWILTDGVWKKAASVYVKGQ